MERAKPFAQGAQLVARAVQLGGGGGLCGAARGQGLLVLGGGNFGGGAGGGGGPPLRGVLAQLHGAQLGGILAVSAGQAGLALQRAQARLKLGQHIFAALQVRARLAQAALGVVLACFKHADLGRVFEQAAALFRAQRQRCVDQTLVDDRVRSAQRADGFLQIAQAHAVAVDIVLVVAGTRGAARDRHLAVGQGQQPVGVIDRQGNFGQAGGRALAAAREQQILGAFRAQRTETLLAQHPAHRVGHVRLPRAVRANDRGDTGAELKDRAGGKRLETLNVEAFEIHGASFAGGKKGNDCGRHYSILRRAEKRLTRPRRCSIIRGR